MADVMKLRATFEADASKLLKGLEKIESSVTDVDSVLTNAFGDVDSVLEDVAKVAVSVGKTLSGTFSEGVSSVSDVTKEVEKLDGKLSGLDDVDLGSSEMNKLNGTIKETKDTADKLGDSLDNLGKGVNNGGVVDGIGEEVLDVEGKVRKLYDDLKEIGNINLKFDTFKGLTDTILDAGVDVDTLGNKLKGLEDSTINWSMLTKLGKEAKEAEGDVDKLSGALRGLGSSGAGGVKSDLGKLGSSAKGAEGEVEKLDGALKGVDSGGLKDVGNDLDAITDKAESAVGVLEGMAGGIGGLAGIGGFSDALDIAINENKISYDMETALRAGGERANVEVALELIGNDYSKLSTLLGDDGAKSLIRTISVQADTKDAEEVAKIVNDLGNKVTTVAVNFDVDATELLEESKALAKILNISQEEALALQNNILAVGLPPGELDIVTEYSNQFARLGFTAEEVQGLFSAGIATGTDNIDQLMDGIKEGRIVLAEFGSGVDDVTADLIKGTGISVKELENWGKAVSKGGEDGSKAMKEVTEEVMGIEDATKRNAVGVKIFGTLWEEQGDNIGNTVINMDKYMTDLGDGVKRVSDETEKLDEEPWLRIESSMADIKVIAGEFLLPIVEVVAKLAEWASENETLVKVLMVIMGVVTMLITVLGVLAAIMGVVALATMTAFGIPLILIALAIAGVLIFTAVWVQGMIQIVDAIKNFASESGEIWTSIKDFFIGIWTSLVEWFKFLWEGAKQIFVSYRDFVNGIWDTVINFFVDMWNKAIEWFKGRWESTKDTFNRLKSFIIEVWESVKIAVVTKVTNLVKNTLNLFSEMKSGISNRVNGVKDVIGDSLSKAYNEVTEWFGKFRTAGGNIVGNIADGISGAWSELKGSFGGVLQGLRDLLPFSPPKDKTSPLVDIHKNGIVGNVAKGILDNKDAIKDAMRKVLDVESELGIDDSKFYSGIGNYKEELGATVNGSVKTTVQSTINQGSGYTQTPAYINFRLGKRNYEEFVADIFNEKNRKDRRSL